MINKDKAKDPIRASEEKLSAVFSLIPDPTTITDIATGRIIDLNDAAARWFGRSREEAIGMTTADVQVWENPSDRDRMLQEMRDRGEINDMAFRLRMHTGELRSVLFSSRILEIDGKRCLLSRAHDITERTQAEDELKESEERFKAITMTASDAILLMDDRGKLVHWNPAADRMFGYTAGEALGKDLHHFLAPRRLHKDYLKGFGHFVKTGTGPVINKAVELTAQRKDGAEFPIEVSTSAMNIKGRWHALGIIRDISDRKRAEREKSLLEDERLKTQKLESLGTLAGGIAHDFNNLLQAVFGFISMAKLTFDRKEKSLAMLAQAEKALHQAVNLTSQLLTFSKGGTPVKKVHALRPLIENAATFALSGSRVTYEIATDRGNSAVEADEGQLCQVIQNIVLNADQAMPLGGRIRISVRNIPASMLVPPADLKGELVEIAICDQGAGIPAEHLTRIFDPYFTTKEKGSGLGLATVYSIIRNHGGLVRVQSDIGKGTTFFIYLAASGTAVQEPKSPVIPEATQKGWILVMDDDEMVRAVAGELLSAIGHEVAFAETGELALEAYQEARQAGRPFDVVILDLTIRGGMGGMEALRKLVELDPGVKAIVSSGYSDDAALSNYREQGFRTFLKKPYDLDELRSTVNALLA